MSSFDETIYDIYQKGKQHKISFKSLSNVTTSKPLELLHIDLFEPSQTQNLGGKKYTYVIVDDYTRYTWVIFLRHKSEAFEEFSTYVLKFKMRKIPPS